MVGALGAEVDRLETEIQQVMPSIRHIDLVRWPLPEESTRLMLLLHFEGCMLKADRLKPCSLMKGAPFCRRQPSFHRRTRLVLPTQPQRACVMFRRRTEGGMTSAHSTRASTASRLIP